MALKRSLICGLLLALGCSKRDSAPHRTEPWLARPSASSVARGGPRAYHFSQGSFVRFSVSGRKGKLDGRVPLTQGLLRIDPRDLQTASASADFDLTKLSVETPVPDNVELGVAASTLAQQWLELGARVPAERRAQFATARFELASVENPSSAFLEPGSARKAAVVRATGVGTLLLHGFRAPLRVELRLSVVDTPPGAPERLSIRSASGVVVPLGPHDIAPRDASGIVDALGSARAADWVGKSVRVEFELLAEAEPPSVN
jgi:hypothetical protein